MFYPGESKEFDEVHTEIFEIPEGNPPDLISVLFPSESKLQVLNGHVAVFKIEEIGQTPELSSDPKGAPGGK